MQIVVTWIALLLLGLTVGTLFAADWARYRVPVTIVDMHTWDAHGILFYQLRFRDGTQATLSVDGDTAFAAQLRPRVNQPLILTLEPVGLDR